MPVKRKGGARKKRAGPVRGKGIFGSIWKGIKRAGKFVKDNKIISTVLKAIPATSAAGTVAGLAGFGRKRRGGARRGGVRMTNGMLI